MYIVRIKLIFCSNQGFSREGGARERMSLSPLINHPDYAPAPSNKLQSIANIKTMRNYAKLELYLNFRIEWYQYHLICSGIKLPTELSGNVFILKISIIYNVETSKKIGPYKNSSLAIQV